MEMLFLIPSVTLKEIVFVIVLPPRVVPEHTLDAQAMYRKSLKKSISYSLIISGQTSEDSGQTSEASSQTSEDSGQT